MKTAPPGFSQDVGRLAITSPTLIRLHPPVRVDRLAPSDARSLPASASGSSRPSGQARPPEPGGPAGAIAFPPTPAITRHPAARRAFALRSTAILITPAFAQAAGAAPAASEQIFQLLTPIVLIGMIMYFLVLRPQQRAARERAHLLKNIRRGDTVITNGGLIGKVTKVVDDAELEVEIAPNVRVRVSRAMVSEVRAKGEPVRDVAKSA